MYPWDTTGRQAGRETGRETDTVRNRREASAHTTRICICKCAHCCSCDCISICSCICICVAASVIWGNQFLASSVSVCLCVCMCVRGKRRKNVHYSLPHTYTGMRTHTHTRTRFAWQHSGIDFYFLLPWFVSMLHATQLGRQSHYNKFPVPTNRRTKRGGGGRGVNKCSRANARQE